MIRFHVIDDQVIDGAVAYHLSNFLNEYLEITYIDRLDQSDPIVIDQIGIVSYAVRQGPKIFEQLFLAIVHAYIIYLSFQFHNPLNFISPKFRTVE